MSSLRTFLGECKLKKISLLVPAYNGLIWLEKNKDFWVEATNVAEVIVVEDSPSRQMENFCLNNNIVYFSKENGNWGSVINFAIKKRIINTEWMAVVDVDDTIKIDELNKLLQILDDKYDVCFTKSDDVDFLSGEKICEHNEKKWVHSCWLKTECFYRMPYIPEGVFYTDQFFNAFVCNIVNKIEAMHLSPYNYFKNIPGQSVSIKNSIELQTKIQSLKTLENNFIPWIVKNEISVSKKIRKSNRNSLVRAIRQIYDVTESKSELLKLRKIYRENCKKVNLFEKLFWSDLFRFFTFKRAKGD